MSELQVAKDDRLTDEFLMSLCGLDADDVLAIEYRPGASISVLLKPQCDKVEMSFVAPDA